MEALEDKFSVKLDSVIKKINGLKSKGGAMATLQERVELLSLGMAIIDKAENELLRFKEINRSYNISEVVNHDFKLSEYAERFYVQANTVIQLLHNNKDSAIMAGISNTTRKQFYDLAYKTLAVSARWHIERMINVFEFDISSENKAFPKRKPLLEECIFFADRMNATKMGIRFSDGIMPKVLIFAVQPSSGKSFVANVYSLMTLCLHKMYFNTSGILRMSNNRDNAEGFADQIKSMIEDEKIAIIYPEFKKYFSVDGKCKILDKSTSGEWKITGLDPRIRASHFARGRESGINSIRIHVALIIDDLSDGFEQMNNDEAHQEMTSKFYVDMKSRQEAENMPVFILGTMFNEFDIQNDMIRDLEEMGMLIQSKKFRNTRHTPDYSRVVIAVDCFDDDGESFAPNLISTEELKERQRKLKPYEFDLVYRQIRSSREPRPFDRGNLRQYDELPKTLRESSIAVLDPTRKNGEDFFSMPVFREDTKSNLYYFVDCIYEQRSLGKLADPANMFLKKVVKFIIKNNIKDFTIENNTSNTIGTILEEKLKEQGYFCKISEIFTAKLAGKKNKLEKILDEEASITANIVFPSARVFPPLHPMSIFMNDLTRFDSKNTSQKKQHDDAPDSLAIFSRKYLFAKKNRYSTISNGFSLKSLWKS